MGSNQSNLIPGPDKTFPAIVGAGVAGTLLVLSFIKSGLPGLGQLIVAAGLGAASAYGVTQVLCTKSRYPDFTPWECIFGKDPVAEAFKDAAKDILDTGKKTAENVATVLTGGINTEEGRKLRKGGTSKADTTLYETVQNQPKYVQTLVGQKKYDRANAIVKDRVDKTLQCQAKWYGSWPWENTCSVCQPGSFVYTYERNGQKRHLCKGTCGTLYSGSFEDDGKCYKCPSGYNMNPLANINAANKCSKGGIFGPTAKAVYQGARSLEPIRHDFTFE